MGANRFLDFGCGKGGVVRKGKEVGLDVTGYDPNVPEFEQFPDKRFDLLFSFDVLEHIPLNVMPTALDGCVRLADVALFVPHLGLANTILPNGENAHCTILAPSEWVELLSGHYPHVAAVEHISEKHVVLIASSKPVGPVVEACKTVTQALRREVSGPTGVRTRLRRGSRMLFGKEMRRAIGRGLRKAVVARRPNL